MTGSLAPWLVLRLRQHQIARAASNIHNQGAEFYAPRALLRSGRTRRLEPQYIFPGYGFARPGGPQWMFLRGTYGVLEVLMAGAEKPAWLDHAEVAKLKAREGPDGLVGLEDREFTGGEHVVVVTGDTSLDAIVVGMRGPDRVLVLMQVLGARRPVEVSVQDVIRDD